MSRTIIVLFLAGVLGACAAQPDAAASNPSAVSPAQAKAVAPDRDEEADSSRPRDGVHRRAIDPDAQKGLVERMKNCCAPAN